MRNRRCSSWMRSCCSHVLPTHSPYSTILAYGQFEHDLYRLSDSESDVYAFTFLQAGDSAIRIFNIGYPDAAVWSIGSDRASSLKELGACALGIPEILAVRCLTALLFCAGEWQNYICFEAAVMEKPIKLFRRTRGRQTFSLLPPSKIAILSQIAK